MGHISHPVPLHGRFILPIHILHQLQLVANRAVIATSLPSRQHARALHVEQRQQLLVPVRLEVTHTHRAHLNQLTTHRVELLPLQTAVHQRVDAARSPDRPVT